MNEVMNDILSLDDYEIATRTGMTPEVVREARKAYQKILAHVESFAESLMTTIGEFWRGDRQLLTLCHVPIHVLISLRDEMIRLARGESDDYA